MSCVAIVALLRRILCDPVATIGRVLAVTGATAVGAVIDAVVTSFRRLNNAVAANRWDTARCRADPVDAILIAVVTALAVFHLDNAVTTARTQNAAHVAEAVAASVHAVVALLATIRTMACLAGIAVIDNGITAICIERATGAAAAALLVNVASAVITFFARLNHAIAATRGQLATRSASARRGAASRNGCVLAVIALFRPVLDGIATEWAPFALRSATTVERVVV